MSDELMSQNYAAKVGARLRSVRKQKRLSLQAVEAASDMEFKASVLGAYERGERSISVPRLQRLAAIYDVPVDQLLPKDTTFPVFDSASLSSGGFGKQHGGLEAISVDSIEAAQGRNGRAANLVESKITIDLTKLSEVSGPERDLLKRYLNMIQVQRQDFNGRMITIRSEDLRVIGALLEMSADQIAMRLDDLGLRIAV
ncbi:MAG: transcriptional regulator [Acidimicrobiaceae bacterium]|nr:transcriptional regulator [Acidimicrobiaceae bacterium]